MHRNGLVKLSNDAHRNSFVTLSTGMVRPGYALEWQRHAWLRQCLYPRRAGKAKPCAAKA
nr:MAG TPA: hypothetical protein [Caudoviricetes sp.]